MTSYAVVRSIRGFCGDLTPVLVEEFDSLETALAECSRQSLAWIERWEEKPQRTQLRQEIIFGLEG